MSYQLGDAVRPNSAKINAVEWAIDVSLTACFLNLNHPGVCNMGVADVGAAAKPAAGLTRVSSPVRPLVGVRWHFIAALQVAGALDA